MDPMAFFMEYELCLNTPIELGPCTKYFKLFYGC